VSPRDYDVVVPFYNWGPAAALIPEDARPNTFGGWKCVVRFGYKEGVSRKLKQAVNWAEIDVWPGDIGWLFQRPMCNWAWHPASGTRLCKITASHVPSGLHSTPPLQDPTPTKGVILE
jgi:hypothetical protein